MNWNFRRLLVLLFVVFPVICGVQVGKAEDVPKASVKPRAIIFDDPAMPGYDRNLVSSLKNTLTVAGYETETGDVKTLETPDKLKSERCALLVLPQARWLPESVAPTIRDFANQGGNLLVLGAPAWQSPVAVLQDNRWRTREEIATTQARKQVRSVFLDFSPIFPLGTLIRETNREQTYLQEITSSADATGETVTALHIAVTDLDGWEMWRTPDLDKTPFRSGETITVFSARGGPRTQRLAVEWDERDGSRWIAVIPLTERWRQYRLTPADFKPWGVSAERERAGFRPENVVRFKAGLAFTHTGREGGAQEYWLAGVGTDTAAQEVAVLPVPVLETIAPAYKFSPVSGTVRLSTPTGQALVTSVPPASVDGMWQITSSPPRPGGGGFDKKRDWRWQPLLTARDAGNGQWRGAPATLMIYKPNTNMPFAGGVWASFAVEETAFYRQPGILRMIGEITRRMRSGLFLIDGGADAYTLLPGQNARLGATIANVGFSKRLVTARIVVTSGPDKSVPIWQKSFPVTLGARSSAVTTAMEWKPPSGKYPPNGYRVVTELYANDVLIDRVEHRLVLWQKIVNPEYVTAGKDGQFWRYGKPWHAFGINYTPSSGIAQENDDLYQRWLSPAAYDPETVERDLFHIEELGFNTVSAWVYPGEATWQNLLDFLRRCRAHHLTVSLMLAPQVGSTGEAASLQPLIERFQLPQNDTLLGYEIAWEPEFNSHKDRKGMDTAWEKWVVERYGSVANAEAKWKTRVPRNDTGKVTNPPDDALWKKEGSTTQLAIAYRLFLDDWLAIKFVPIVNRLHGIDPHHLVSFRMNHGGDPTNRGGMPYTFEGLAGAVDYFGPEAYGRVGDWDRVKPGIFTAAYGRAIAPHKPIIWMEAGTSVWDATRNNVATDQLAFQGRFYDDFFRMAINSGANGIFFWWFAGGYRYGEGSDYGVLNPDGTDRPATTVIRRNGVAFKNAPMPTPNEWLFFDRNTHPDGLVGVYDALSERFWAAIAQGRVPGLRVKTDNITNP